MKSISLKKWLSLLGFILLIPSLLLNVYLYQKSRKTADSGLLVIEVLDGDTILLEGKVRLRLRDVDAPELEFCGGEKAKNLLTDLVKDKRVTIKEQIIDQWGRPMGLVYEGEILVNAEMLKSGWVRYHHDQGSIAKELKEIADQAKSEAIGIYGSCVQKENPENPNCNIKGNIDKNSDLRNYYFPGCAQYDFTIVEKDLGEQWFCTEKEAQSAGFTKAKTCE